MTEWGHVPQAYRLASPHGPSGGRMEQRAGHQAAKPQILLVVRKVLGKRDFLP